MLRNKAGRLHTLILAFDHLLSAATCVGVLALPGMVFFPAGDVVPVRLIVVALAATLLWPFLFEILGLYRSQRRESLSHVLAQIALAALVSTAALTALAHLVTAPVAPVFPALVSAAQLVTLGSLRIAIFTGLRLARRHGRNYRNVLIVGSGPRARQARAMIERHPEWGLRLLGFADDRDTPVDPALDGVKVYKLSELPQLVGEEVIDEVLIACPRSMLASLDPVVRVCAAVGVPLTLVSDLFGDILPRPQTSRFGDLPTLSFAVVDHSHVMLWLKRGLDIVVSSSVLLLTAPLLVGAAVVIKATSPGPVLFEQMRCGLHGRRFRMLKLRTMHQGAEAQRKDLEHLNEATGPVFKIRHDPRITPVGRILRRWSLDELPQLWNVLRGDMSLVGPRPPLPAEVAQYETFQRRRLSMRPGLTCLWQVNGRSEIGFDEWVEMDLQYIDAWSLSQDLKILVRTVPAVFRGTGAA
jgi:exopolysaccharide biosynthesis polyprenyl glycosylphosphotransferase